MDLSDIGSAFNNLHQSASDWLSDLGDDLSEDAFRRWALSEAWTAANVFMPLYLQATNLNHLTDDMLAMYLNGTQPDQTIIDQVAREIEQSDTFDRMADVVRRRIQSEVNARRRSLSQQEVDRIARSIINPDYVDPTTGSSMYFNNSDRGLQGVIGGIHSLSVKSTSVSGSRYEVVVTITDKYDFDNRQNTSADPDLASYVRFRNQLLDHIRNRRYRQFLMDYHQSLYFGNPIIRSRTFAAFMYAIEKAGYTPGGVMWSADASFDGTMSLSASSRQIR